MTALEQARVFLAMALCGALCAAGHDALHALAAAGGGRLLRGAADLLFGPLCAVGMVLTALCMRVDPLRWFEFAGLALGVALYELSAGAAVHYIFKIIRNLIEKT